MIVNGWHGAHNWEGPPEIRRPRKGHYEHGCGIYVTNIWARAAKYAKGGGSVMRLTIEAEPLAPDAVDIQDVARFVSTCPGLRNRKGILDYLVEHSKKDFFPEYLNNLCVNEEALTSVSAPLVARWLTDHGMPYLLSSASNTYGDQEEWMVIFDPDVIKRIEPVRSSELDRLPSYGDRNYPLFSEQLDRPEDTPGPFRPR